MFWEWLKLLCRVLKAELLNYSFHFTFAILASFSHSIDLYTLSFPWMKLFADILLFRYWKLSLMVHPDKSSHPQAHQAFVKLNKAFKDLQDPAKVRIVKRHSFVITF